MKYWLSFLMGYFGLGIVNLWIRFSWPEATIIGTSISVLFVLLMILSILAVGIAIGKLLVAHKISRAIWTLIFYLLLSLLIRVVLTLGLIATEKPQSVDVVCKVGHPLAWLDQITGAIVPYDWTASFKEENRGGF